MPFVEPYTKEEVDIFVKQEGYHDIKFLTQKAKEWAHEAEIPNALARFGMTFCGKPVWYFGMNEGQYQYGAIESDAIQILRAAHLAGLKIESETIQLEDL